VRGGLSISQETNIVTLPLRKREETGNTKLFLKLRDTHLLDFLFTPSETLYLQGFQTPFRNAPKTHGECL